METLHDKIFEGLTLHSNPIDNKKKYTEEYSTISSIDLVNLGTEEEPKYALDNMKEDAPQNITRKYLQRNLLYYYQLQKQQVKESNTTTSFFVSGESMKDFINSRIDGDYEKGLEILTSTKVMQVIIEKVYVKVSSKIISSHYAYYIDIEE